MKYLEKDIYRDLEANGISVDVALSSEETLDSTFNLFIGRYCSYLLDIQVNLD